MYENSYMYRLGAFLPKWTKWAKMKTNLKKCFTSSDKQSAIFLVHHLENLLGEVWGWPLYTEDKKRPKKEKDHARLVGGSFNNQGGR